METFTGTASEVVHSVLIGGEHGDAYVAKFLLDGTQRVRVRSSTRLKIANGDHVALTGSVWGDELRVLAYWNLTTGTRGNSGRLQFALAGLFLLLTFNLTPDPQVAALVGIGCGWFFFLFGRVILAERKLARDVSCHHRPTEGPSGVPLGES